MFSECNNKIEVTISEIIKSLKEKGYSNNDIINYLTSLQGVINSYKIMLMKESIISKLNEIGCKIESITTIQDSNSVSINCTHRMFEMKVLLYNDKPNSVEVLIKPRGDYDKLMKFLNENMVFNSNGWYSMLMLFSYFMSFIDSLCKHLD